MTNDSLGDRIKHYEKVTQQHLMRRAYTVIRCDAKAFHTYTKGLIRPFDDALMEDMDAAALFLCKEVQGAKCAFVQSDEISVIITDFEEYTTQSWFDSNIQKMVSISASAVTAEFNRCRYARGLHSKTAQFDSRVFQVPNCEEAINVLVWRQQDTVRNSISSVAQSLYSHKELHLKNNNQMQEMIFQKGINWNDYAPRYKRGRIIVKREFKTEEGAIRNKWVVEEPPIFTQNREYLYDLIPNRDEDDHIEATASDIVGESNSIVGRL